MGNEHFSAFTDSLKLNSLNYFKTGNIVLDIAISSIIISFFAFLSGYISDKMYEIREKTTKNLNTFSFSFRRKNTILLTGETIRSNNYYFSKFFYSPTYSAVIDYIIKNDLDKSGIHNVQEFQKKRISSYNEEQTNKDDTYTFIVNQPKSFKLFGYKDIFVSVSSFNDTRDSKDGEVRISHKTDINIYSYKKSLEQIKKIIDDITDKYLINIQESRYGKLFIYSLENAKFNSDTKQKWHECIFESTRNFNNIFFEQKNTFMTKLDFFINNHNWYKQIGIPYTFGILLHGPPGTGKTSLTKCIANYLKRNIIIIPLSKINSIEELHTAFFEATYNENNKENSIQFKNKIIVFEDVDCMSDIIKKRKEKNKEDALMKMLLDMDKTSPIEGKNIDGMPISGANTNLQECVSIISKQKTQSNEITLSYILNLIDGIKETPGRIMIFTTNHPEQIDPALIRPGRIDIKINFTNATSNVIKDIYKQLFNEDIPTTTEFTSKLESINLKYSPAEIYNIFFENPDKSSFIKKLFT